MLFFRSWRGTRYGAIAIGEEFILGSLEEYVSSTTGIFEET
jgi:hypothetical protein